MTKKDYFFLALALIVAALGVRLVSISCTLLDEYQLKDKIIPIDSKIDYIRLFWGVILLIGSLVIFYYSKVKKKIRGIVYLLIPIALTIDSIRNYDYFKDAQQSSINSFNEDLAESMKNITINPLLLSYKDEQMHALPLNKNTPTIIGIICVIFLIFSIRAFGIINFGFPFNSTKTNYDSLEKLAKLYSSGAITEEEFKKEKSKLLQN